MEKSQTTPKIFDRELLAKRRGRGLRRNTLPFLMERCAKDCAEKILDINRQFKRALIIAPPEAIDLLIDALPEPRRPSEIVRAYFSSDPTGLDLTIDEENLPFQSPQFDLIISILGLQSVNDLPGSLIQFNQALLPDGVFLASLFAGHSGQELRQLLYHIDDKIISGMTPRVFPFADHLQLAALLQRTGFALPVIDTDRFKVNYKSVDRLFGDLRDLGETNILAARHKKFAGKKYLEALRDEFSENYMQKGMDLSVEIMWLTGWSPHESQQKPLKPGSAEVSLKAVLKNKINEA